MYFFPPFFFFLLLLTYEDNVKPYKNVCNAKQMSTDYRSSFHGSSPLAGPGLERGALRCRTPDPASSCFQKAVKEYPLYHRNLQPQCFSQGPFPRQRLQVKTQNFRFECLVLGKTHLFRNDSDSVATVTVKINRSKWFEEMDNNKHGGIQIVLTPSPYSSISLKDKSVHMLAIVKVSIVRSSQ